LKRLANGVEDIFAQVGLSFVPRPVKLMVAGTIFAMPIVLMLYVICCMGAPDYGDFVKGDLGAKKGAGARREKIE